MAQQTKGFSDTRIFATAGLLLRESFAKVRNMQTDVKLTVGNSFINNVKRCTELMRLSYEAEKNNKELKLAYAYVARDCVGMAETDLQIIVVSDMFPGKPKKGKTGLKTVPTVKSAPCLTGTPELYFRIGDLITQIKGWINNLEKDFSEEEILKIKEKTLNLTFKV